MAASDCSEQQEWQDATVAIVGAGMSGLIAARALLARGIDTVVLEAADRPGGRLLAETSVLGSRVDLGGQWIGHGHHRAENLVAELGLTPYQMRSPKSPAILFEGKKISSASAPVIVSYIAVGVADALSRIRGRSWSNEASLQSWIDKVPSRRARQLLEALTNACFTADADQLSVEAFMQMVRHEGGLWAMMKTVGGAQENLLIEGAGELVEQLAVSLGPRVFLDCPVTAINQRDGAVELDTPRGRVRARKVLITVPPPIIGRIAFNPPLPRERAALSDTTAMGVVYKALAIYETPFWRDRVHAESICLGGIPCAVFDSSTPDGPGHLCILVGGSAARALDDMDVNERQSALLGPLAALVGTEVLTPVGWHDKAWHRDSFVGGGYAALPAIGTTDGFYPVASTPVGDLHWAGTETATEHAGYMEGAIESGQRAAAEILEALGEPNCAA